MEEKVNKVGVQPHSALNPFGPDYSVDLNKFTVSFLTLVSPMDLIFIGILLYQMQCFATLECEEGQMLISFFYSSNFQDLALEINTI